MSDPADSGYWAELRRSLESLVPPSTPRARADDAVQAVLLALWQRHLAHGAELRAPRAYLRTCLRRALIRLARREWTVSLDHDPPSDVDVEAEVGRALERRAVLAALGQRAPVTLAGALRQDGHRQRAALRRMHREGGK